MASEIYNKNMEIIDNALETAQQSVGEASDAAQAAMQAAAGTIFFDQQYREFQTAVTEPDFLGDLSLIDPGNYADWNNYPVAEPDKGAGLNYINQAYDSWSSGSLTRPDSSERIDLIPTDYNPWVGITAVEPPAAGEAAEQVNYFYQPYLPWAPAAVEPAVYIPTTAEETDPFRRYDAEKAALAAYLQNLFEQFFATYYPLANDAMDEAIEWLRRTITEGGTGIPQDVENLIWQRHRDNLQRGTTQAKNQAMAEFASRGFNLPPGALVARLQNLDMDGLAKLSEASRDLAIKRMEIEIENIKFAVELATKLRLNAMQAATDYIKAMMLAPETATKLVDQNTNAQARLISATADFYRARLIRDDLTMKAWGTLMEQKSKDGSINIDAQTKMLSASADLYRARTNQDELSLKAWIAELEQVTAVGKANIDAQTKILATDADLYRAEIMRTELDMKAWATKLEQRGKDGQANLSAQVNAVSADAALFRARIDEKEMSLKAWMAEIDQDIKIKLGNLDAQSKAIGANSDILRARVAHEDVKMRAWAALMNQKGTDGRTNVDGWVRSIDAKVRAAVGAADAYGRNAQAALNSLTSIVSTSTQAFET